MASHLVENEEVVIRKSIISSEMFVDALRNIVGKGRLNTRDEEIVLNALFPSDQPIPPSWCLENGTLLVEKENNIPQLKALVENELGALFDEMDSLKEIAGFGGFNSSLDSGLLKSAASAFISTGTHLEKQYSTLHSLRTKEFATPLIKSLETLSSSANEFHHRLKEMDHEIMTEKFGGVSEKELEAIVENLKTTWEKLSSEDSAVYDELDKYQEHKEDFLSLARQLKEVEVEAEFTEAALLALDLSVSDGND